MPADYNSAAAGLSVSPSASATDGSHNPAAASAASAASRLAMDPSSPPSHSPSPFRDEDDDHDDHADAPPSSTAPPSVPWARGTGQPAASRRLSTPYSRHGSHASACPTDLRGQITALGTASFKTARNLYRRSAAAYAALSPTQQFLVLSASVLLLALTVTLLVFSQKIFTLLGPVAVSWRALPAGWLIIWVLTFLVAFPPLVGYSTACTVAGFVYGFPLGWPIVATATVAGSAAAFVASRTVLSAYVDRLVGADRRFVALGQVLRHDGLGVLALVRFCPLPYSLSNGFLATVPSVRTASFALATALASPKLLVHVFIGSRLALLAEKGDEMGFGDKLVNYLSMGVGGLVGAGVGYFIYRRTMARAAELAREEAEAGRPFEEGRGRVDYADEDGAGGEDARLMDPNDAAALMVDDDDISLWDQDDGGFEEDGRTDGRYRDEEEAVGGVGAKTGSDRE